jgi:MFS family permease
VVLASTGCLLLGTLGYSLASQLGLLSVSMGVLGFGLGGVDMAGYLIIVAYYTQNKGRYLNLTAFFHGLASTIAPYYAGLLLAAGISWRQVYQYPLACRRAYAGAGVAGAVPETACGTEKQDRLSMQLAG